MSKKPGPNGAKKKEFFVYLSHPQTKIFPINTIEHWV